MTSARIATSMNPAARILNRHLLPATARRTIPRPIRTMTSQASSPTVVSTDPPPSYIFAPADGVSNSRASQYTLSSLSARSLSPDPIIQFQTWFSAATASKAFQPETCTLSTADRVTGRVSARMVYMKELDARGWVIYSNFGTSGKRAHLFGADEVEVKEGNGWASLTFWWREVERQVRVEGRTERLTEEESMRYFRTRERGSRIGAWASLQSGVLADVTEKVEQGAQTKDGGVTGQEERMVGDDEEMDDGRGLLEQRVKDVEKRFEGVNDIPLPDFWGGLRIKPESVEFWQGRPSRLHDRFRYSKVTAGEASQKSTRWKVDRLSP